MKKISNTLDFNILLKLLYLFLLADLFSLFLAYYLPVQGVNNMQNDHYEIPYIRTNLQNMFPDAKQVKSDEMQTLQSMTISDIILKGLYGNEKTGFVIVSLKSERNKTKIVAIGENFHGYVLRSIALKSAKFMRNGQEYTVNLEQPHTVPSFNISSYKAEKR
ncbi:hypothetical protein [Sulfurimonas sp. HSL-1716]|uniref:hypothetical protein n=1 Tax=Hydrocurvibacter sulfurireducens TaxID=3131937 RepID=UPI0031F92E7F